MNNLPYDDTNPTKILEYAQKLIGLKFLDILEQNIKNSKQYDFNEEVEVYNNPKKKGSLGNLLEEHYFFFLKTTVVKHRIFILIEQYQVADAMLSCGKSVCGRNILTF